MHELHKVLTELFSSLRCVQLNLLDRKTEKIAFQLPLESENDKVEHIDLAAICSQAQMLSRGKDELNQILVESGKQTHFLKWLNEDYIIHVVGLSEGLNVGKYNALLSLMKNRIGVA